MLFCVCLYEALMMSKTNYCITPYGPDILSEIHISVHRGQNCVCHVPDLGAEMTRFSDIDACDQ